MPHPLLKGGFALALLCAGIPACGPVPTSDAEVAELPQEFNRLGPYYHPWNRGDKKYARNEILFAAVNQLGRDTKDSRFREIYHNNGQEWCSEFVSWIYNSAQVPFTGGASRMGFSSADWNLETTGEIISYFQAQNSYVLVRDLRETPRLGDYAYIESADRTFKHSAIVLGVRKDARGAEILVTVEGNHRGRPVSIFHYPDWRLQKARSARVVGIGFRRDLPPPVYELPMESRWFNGQRITD